MKPILEVQEISKRYTLHQLPGGYLSLRERLLKGFFDRSRTIEEFWALKDVSFTVQPGESIGIVGRNGAGKSTLLKVLSRITPPSKGRIVSRGRIASLLEVGTGFHPELTGRENIFFNGSLLGMKRKEIQSKFDEIVEFSGTAKFLETPLKHYSSGMQLRLAFSVAAFLEPEILVIDEVLAVGDAEFQRKCIGKMQDVSTSGRTILFVSHNMAAIETLCRKALVLKQGQISFIGSSADAIQHYLSGLELSSDYTGFVFMPKRKGIVEKVEFLSNGQFISPYMGCELDICVYFQSDKILDLPVVGLIFKDSHNTPLLAVNNKHYQKLYPTNIRKGVMRVKIPYLTLFSGRYSLDLHFGDGFSDIEVYRDFFTMKVEPIIFTESGEIPDPHYNRFFIPNIKWTLESHDTAC